MITFFDQFYSKYYYDRRATLSIGNVLPLCRIPEGAVVCNVWKDQYAQEGGVNWANSKILYNN